MLFQSKNAESDSLLGKADASLSGLRGSLAAASLSAVNRPKVTPWVPQIVSKSYATLKCHQTHQDAARFSIKREQ
ncbi:hypothetical protein PXH59_02085 [Xenorhabdus sp. SF857]|uniref:hypothetical protein n=1 Tax=Xenorhabdus bakwenae TaxID=3026967 RepID=UPI00255833F6|nr:hypothetical protein [Xenorhabdus sp. SF857]WFQ80002.1 hypothetical protein PXH59_02085 [Xenorhabdus sp. SF857]